MLVDLEDEPDRPDEPSPYRWWVKAIILIVVWVSVVLMLAMVISMIKAQFQ